MFTIGKSYVRRGIHAELGGQAQGGISTPAGHDLLLVFTGEQGEQYGYRDGWTEDGVFMYTGEGQRGNMEFVRGNSALRDHTATGKDVHLFEYVDRGIVRYVGQMVCVGFERRPAPDIDGNERSAIVFELMPLEAFSPSADDESAISPQLEGLSLPELRRRALDAPPGPRPPRESKHQAHSRSMAVRAYALSRAAGVCEACGNAAPFQTASGRPYLEPHHIRRVSDGGPDHPAWVSGVCPNCHRRAHYSADKAQFNDHLREIVFAKERELGLDA